MANDPNRVTRIANENVHGNLITTPSKGLKGQGQNNSNRGTPGARIGLSGLIKDAKRAENALFSPKSVIMRTSRASTNGAARTPVASNKKLGSRLGSGLKSGPVRVKTPSRKPSDSLTSSRPSPRAKTAGGPSSELLKSTKNSVAGRYQGFASKVNSPKPKASGSRMSKSSSLKISSPAPTNSRPATPVPPSSDMDISAITDASLYANPLGASNDNYNDDGSLPSLPPPEPTLKSTTLLPPTPPSAVSATAAAPPLGFSNPNPSSYIVNMPNADSNSNSNSPALTDNDGNNTVGSLDSSIMNNPGWRATPPMADGSVGEGRCGDPVAKVFHGSDDEGEVDDGEDDVEEEKKEELRRGGAMTPVHPMYVGVCSSSAPTLGVRQLSNDLEVLKMEEGGKKSPKLRKPKPVKITELV